MTGPQVIRARDLLPQHMMPLDYVPEEYRKNFEVKGRDSLEVAGTSLSEEGFISVTWNVPRLPTSNPFTRANRLMQEFTFPLDYLVIVTDDEHTLPRYEWK